MANAFKIKTFNQIQTDMQNFIIANQDKVSDFNEGSLISSQIEATAEEFAQLYNRTDSGFKKYMLQLAFSVFDFKQKEGQAASVGVVFTRDTADLTSVSIPVGTIVASSSGMYFETTAGGTISSGQTDSNIIQAIAQEVGTEGNVSYGSITVIVTPVNGVDSVNNPNPATGGQDVETDYEFRQRFSEYLLGLGGTNTYGIIAEAKSVTGVRSASTIEHSPPLDDLYHLSLYIDDGTGSASSELVSTVELRILGDGTAENPGKKGGGITMRVLAPTKVAIDVDVTVEDTGLLAWETVEFNVRTAITSYLNNLKIGEEFILNQLTREIMSVKGVFDLSFTAPVANVTIGNDQIARAGTVAVTRA